MPRSSSLLALKYRWVLERLEAFRGRKIETVHIVGGGTQNRLLSQLTADATQRQVIAGPVEATAIGNVLTQAIGRGHVGSLAQAREIVRRSFELEVYEPAANAAHWSDAYARFQSLRAEIGAEDENID
jgi:rhamnulokinase